MLKYICEFMKNIITNSKDVWKDSKLNKLGWNLLLLSLNMASKRKLNRAVNSFCFPKENSSESGKTMPWITSSEVNLVSYCCDEQILKHGISFVY